MFKILSVMIVCAFYKNYNVLAGPTQINVAERTFRNDVNYPVSKFCDFKIQIVVIICF